MFPKQTSFPLIRFIPESLNKTTKNPQFQPIQDPDPLMNCDLMDGRDAFLTLARDKHYEFSSLRRAQFSTLSMLYELHNQGQGDKFVYTCNNCKAAVETRYHCTVCDVSVVIILCKYNVPNRFLIPRTLTYVLFVRTRLAIHTKWTNWD